MSCIHRRRVEAMICGFPEGISVTGLRIAFDRSPSPKTIRKYLKMLQDAGLATKDGKFWIPDKKILGRVRKSPDHSVPKTELKTNLTITSVSTQKTWRDEVKE